MKKYLKIITLGILIVITVGAFIYYQKSKSESSSDNSSTIPKVVNNDTPSSQIANPASINCKEQGGTLVIQKRGDGGEYGLCYFEDNRACEEWALMRGDCPVGGMKTTGYDTIDQKYCAWAGGQTLAVSNSICTFKDGSNCSTIDFYNGKCEKTSVPSSE